MERSFRITQKQLNNLGSLMASKATGSVILASCGRGRAVFPDATERESWSYIGGEKELGPSVFILCFHFRLFPVYMLTARSGA